MNNSCIASSLKLNCKKYIAETQEACARYACTVPWLLQQYRMKPQHLSVLQEPCMFTVSPEGSGVLDSVRSLLS